MVRPVTDPALLQALESAPADTGVVTDPTLLAALESAPVDQPPAPLRDPGAMTLAEKAALWFNQATGGGAAQAGEAARGFVRGAAKPVVGAYQLASRLVPGASEVVDRAIAEQESKDQMLGYGTGNEMLGAVVSPVNLGIAAATPIYRGAVGVGPQLAQYAKNVGAAGASGIAMGATTPVVDPSRPFIEQKTDQMALGGGVGALAGGVAVPLVQGVGAGLGYARDLATGVVPKIQAARIARATLGDGQTVARQSPPSPNQTRIQKVQEWLTGGTPAVNAPVGQTANVQRGIAGASDDITAAQAAKDAGVGTSEFQALGGMVAARDTPIENYYKGLAEKQAAERMRALTVTSPDEAAAVAARSQITDPMYAAATSPANLADTRAIVANIDTLLRRKGSNAELTAELTKLRNGLVGSTGKPYANAERVASAMDSLKVALRDEKNKYIRGELRQLKNDLASAIPGYQAADKAFAQLSQPVNQAQVLTELRGTLAKPGDLGENARTFLGQTEPGRPGVLSLLRRADTGLPRFTGSLDEVLTGQGQMGAVAKARGELSRDLAMKEEAKQGQLLLQRAVEEKNPNFRLPSFFNKWVTAANNAIEKTETGLAKKTIDQLVEGMKTGKKLSDLLNTVPTSERNKFLRMLVRSEGAAAPITAAGMANQ